MARRKKHNQNPASHPDVPHENDGSPLEPEIPPKKGSKKNKVKKIDPF